MSPHSPTDSSIIDLLFAAAERYPDRTALIDDSGPLNYRTLAASVREIALALKRKGPASGERLAIALPSSSSAVVAMISVMASGQAYVPVDISWPIDRATITCKLAGVRAVIMSRHTPSTFQSLSSVAPLLLIEDLMESPETMEVRRSFPDIEKDSLSHIVFTSGSTGSPKGIMGEHGGILNLYHAINELLGTSLDCPPQKVALLSPLTFDGSIREILSLLNGATLVVVPDKFRGTAEPLAFFLRQHEIQRLYCTPSQLVLLDAVHPDIVSDSSFLEIILLGAETIPLTLWSKLKGLKRLRSWNIYGPTECTVDATAIEIGDASSTPEAIGYPLSGVSVYVVRDDLSPTDDFEIGELLIGGKGVCRGYLDDPERTSVKFIPNPFTGGADQLYRTGDRASRQPNGVICYHGRQDSIVKWRGITIDLCEIDAHIMASGLVKQGITLKKTDTYGMDELIVYFVAEGNYEDVQPKLIEHLKQHLPATMIPKLYVPCPALPLNLNGKIDTHALDTFGSSRSPSESLEEVSSDPITRLIQLVQKAFPNSTIDPQTPFFDMGGNSLRLVVLRQQIQTHFSIDISLADMFEHGTLESLSGHIKSKLAKRPLK